MGKGTRRRNTKARRKEKRRTGGAQPISPTSVHDLPDELLDHVLLGLGSPLFLVRAAATCRRLRRAVADAGFLARFRSHNGAAALVAGHYYVTDPYRLHDKPQAAAPEKPAVFVPTSPAVVCGGHFSLDFLFVAPGEIDDDRRRRLMYYDNIVRLRPSFRVSHGRTREIIDTRGSLVLLNNGPWLFSLCYFNGINTHHQRSPDLIVCEPVTRRCQGITRPADFSRLLFLGAFLLEAAGGDGGGGDAMSSFRVLYVLYRRSHQQPYNAGTPRAFVFVPGSEGGWSLGWRAGDDDLQVPAINQISLAGRAAGKIYWGIENGTVLVLDEATLEFRVLTFPAQMQWPYARTSFRVIGGMDDATVRVVRMDGEDLEVFGRMPGAEPGQWVVEKSVRLRDAAAGLPGWDDRFLLQPARIVAAGDSFVVLTPVEETWLFSVELETMEVEREHERNRHFGPAYPCKLPWPPVLQACVGKGGKRRQRHDG